MDEITKKQADLAVRLYRLTMAKVLDWDVNEYEGNRLEAKLNDMEIVLFNTEYEGTPFEYINVYRRGSIIQSFHDGGFVGKPPVDEFESYWHMMVALRETAERQSLKIEQHLDAVLKALDEIEKPKPKPNNPFDSDLDDDVPF